MPSAPTVTLPTFPVEQLKKPQEDDPVTSQIQKSLQDSPPKRPTSNKLKKPPLHLSTASILLVL